MIFEINQLLYLKSVFLYCIKQIDSMLPCVCSVNRSQYNNAHWSYYKAHCSHYKAQCVLLTFQARNRCGDSDKIKLFVQFKIFL